MLSATLPAILYYSALRAVNRVRGRQLLVDDADDDGVALVKSNVWVL